MDEQDFEYLARLLKERSGLALTREKEYLINTRLKPVMEKHGAADLSALVRTMRGVRGRPVIDDVVDAMMTHESLFFRDRAPFDALVSHMVPTLLARRPSRTLRIWCTAASTGQEPYSIAILMEENAARLRDVSVEIVASDISEAALGRARSGEYTQFEVGRGMPSEYLSRYFRKAGRNHYKIAPAIRSRVKFECRNLLEPFNALGRFDIVFCRNVLIYFDRPTKSRVLEKIAGVMPSDGYLVLGGPETTLGLTRAFERHRDLRNVYVRRASDECAIDPRRVA